MSPHTRGVGLALLAAGISGCSTPSGGGSSALGSTTGATSSASITGGGTAGSSHASSGALTSGSGTSSRGTTGSASSGSATSSGSGGDAGLIFAVDLSKGPARQLDPPSAPVPVSPYVYGINQFAAAELTTQWGLLRWGGDAFTDWNWTNNYSNAGADYCFWQGNEGGGTQLAGTINVAQSGSAASLPADQVAGIASLVTVPILDYVSSSAVTNNVYQSSNPPCPGTPPACSSGTANGLDMNVGGLPFASTTDGGSDAFVENSAVKGTALCTGVGQSCTPDRTGPVFADEFVSYLAASYAGGAPIFLSLDNEPNYWGSTHPELWPYSGTLGCGTSGVVTYDDIVTRDTSFAAAVKNVWAQAEVFGPIVAQDGILYAADYGNPLLSQTPPTLFADYYLQQMAAASDAAGHPLIDLFDVHYYTANGDPAQCLQVPRMFWDPAFMDFTAAATDAIDFGWSGLNGYFDSDWYPRKMAPRLLGMIAADYQGHVQAAPGLSFSEYNAGCESSIEGGVAEADLLGVFGREGVTAATAWPLQSLSANYLVAAYGLYRNYDGAGSAVGDTAVLATTPDVEDTSVYAFTHSADASQVELVAVNKTASGMPVTIRIANSPALKTATLYGLTGAQAAVAALPGAAPAVACAGGSCSLSVTLPATSATTIVLK